MVDELVYGNRDLLIAPHENEEIWYPWRYPGISSDNRDFGVLCGVFPTLAAW